MTMRYRLSLLSIIGSNTPRRSLRSPTIASFTTYFCLATSLLWSASSGFIVPPIQRRVFTATTTLSKSLRIRRASPGTHQPRLWSSLDSGGGEQEVAQDEDFDRWERMYMDGELRKKETMDQMGSSNEGISDLFGKSDGTDFMDNDDGAIVAPVHVVTFDLDNTIWKTGPTISGANDALATFLETELQLESLPKRVENIMGILFKENKLDYTNSEDEKGPTQLTKLRKDATRSLLKDYVGIEEEDRVCQIVDKAFQTWTDVRHELIMQHLASNVLPTLEQLRSIGTSATESHRVLMGAITDGNSDPRTIPALAPYFDFVVNAEAVGVSKPNREIYLAAMRVVAKELFSNADPDESSPLNRMIIAGDWEELTDSQLEEVMGHPWWIHVGDDFLKDVVAAKNMGFRSVWCKELVKDKLEATSKTNAIEETKKPEKTVEEFVREMADRQSDDGVVKMSLGASDYLAASLQDEFVDAEIEKFEALGDLLEQWHHIATKEQEQQQTTLDEQDEFNLDAMRADNYSLLRELQREQKQTDPTEPTVADVDDPLTSISSPTAATGGVQVENDTAFGQEEPAEPTEDTKFCIFCGTKLPSVAKFCSNCGEKLP